MRNRESWRHGFDERYIAINISFHFSYSFFLCVLRVLCASALGGGI